MILLGLSLVAGYFIVAPYLMALFVGGILTLIINPVYSLLRRRHVRPHFAAAIATILMVLLIVGPFLSFAAIAVNQAISGAQWLASIEHLSLQDSLTKINAWGPITYLSLDPGELNEHVKSAVRYVGTAGSQFVLRIAKSVPEGILQLILACFTCYCLLIDGRRFFTWIFSKLPMAGDVRTKITSSFKDTAISVILASMAAAGAQSLMMMFGFALLRVPNVFLAGGATFILAWIPIAGSTPVWLAGAFYLYMQESFTRAVLMIVLGLITGTIDNFIRPMVLKGRGEMHPLVSLVAIFGGLQLFGFFGVFLGPILVAVVITLLQLWPLVARPFGLVFAGDEEDQVL